MNVNVELPDPDDFPDADIVIFDGNCNFCRAQVARLKKWDGQNRLSYLSLHDPRIAEEFPDLTHDQLMEQMYVIERKSKRAHGGAKALRYLSRKLPKLWAACPFLHIPLTLPLWQWIYNQVAKRRYRIAGKNESDCDNDACSVHFDRTK